MDAVVAVIMGSQSDWSVMKPAAELLDRLGIPHECKIVSAHRTPERLFEFARGAQRRGLKVIIAGAGGAAHLPGMVAALTTLPVVGVPVKSKALSGVDSQYSIAQMPPGIPVGTMAIDGALNAGLFAASILALQDPVLDARLAEYRAKQTASVAEVPVDAQACIAEGKTKQIFSIGDPYNCRIFSKDDITAGDGKKHDVIPGKGALANRTTCNIFRLLKKCGIAVAFKEQDGSNSFIAPLCEMLPYEVVVRREAHGSYLKRNPSAKRGDRFEPLLAEKYLKTKGKRWRGHELPCDDPYMLFENNSIGLCRPDRPFGNGLLILREDEVFSREHEADLFPQMQKVATDAFLILEEAFGKLGFRYVDYKVEFGLDRNGVLLLADTIDNDSGRLLDKDGSYVDKQYYRDGGDLENTKRLYEMVADLTDRF